MLREEHWDAFGNLSGTTYTHEVAVTSSAVTGPVIRLVNDDTNSKPIDVALFRLRLWVTQAFVTADSADLTIEVKAANALSSGALASPVTVYTAANIAASALTVKAVDNPVVDIVLPRGYKYAQVKLTPLATKSFSAGKIDGYFEPEFN